ncbi:MAG: hypothetical protein KAI33_07120 [Elusimicrobiales bacterium]|nr:hypothetical protein [Elusimicrobiales bacterium]
MVLTVNGCQSLEKLPWSGFETVKSLAPV